MCANGSRGSPTAHAASVRQVNDRPQQASGCSVANRAGHGFAASGRCCSHALATARARPPVNHVQVPGSWLPNTDSGQVAFTAARTATAATALASEEQQLHPRLPIAVEAPHQPRHQRGVDRQQDVERDLDREAPGHADALDDRLLAPALGEAPIHPPLLAEDARRVLRRRAARARAPRPSTRAGCAARGGGRRRSTRGESRPSSRARTNGR